MFNAFLNCFKIPELRQKILVTLALLFVARVGANIPLPGINPLPLQEYYNSLKSSQGSLLGLYNMFTGGALLNGAVFALGIMPYISASIIMQLMGAVVPSLARLQQEGDVGRQKITQYTRYLTIGIALVQGILLNLALINYPDKLFMGYDIGRWGSIIIMDPNWFLLTSTLFLTAGCVLLMWIGEKITELGIANGISLLITIGILADVPSAISFAYELFTAPAGSEAQLSAPAGVLLLAFFLIVVAGIVMLTQGMRKIPVQYAKRVVGRKVFGGQSSFLPLKVNYSGVMPVIFAAAIIMFPQQIANYLGGITDWEGFTRFSSMLTPSHWPYYVFYSILIIGFAYFWVSIMFKPIQIAEDLKKNGGYIPGVRPGEPTAKFLDFVMTRLTLFGALALTLIAIIPTLVSLVMKIPFQVSQFFGGTGTLIAVGVTIDTMQKIETYLIQRHYDGFLKKGKARNRSRARGQAMDTDELKNFSKLYWATGTLFVIGLASWVIRNYAL